MANDYKIQVNNLFSKAGFEISDERDYEYIIRSKYTNFDNLSILEDLDIPVQLQYSFLLDVQFNIGEGRDLYGQTFLVLSSKLRLHNIYYVDVCINKKGDNNVDVEYDENNPSKLQSDLTKMLNVSTNYVFINNYPNGGDLFASEKIFIYDPQEIGHIEDIESIDKFFNKLIERSKAAFEKMQTSINLNKITTEYYQTAARFNIS